MPTVILPDLSAAVLAAEGNDPDCYNTEALWALADLLESVSPTTAPERDDLIEAALLLFADVELGPPRRALAWLHYLQPTCTQRYGLLDHRTRRVNIALARRYFEHGDYPHAADAWQAAIRAYEHQGDEDSADELRIDHAVCLYAFGRCDEATTLLREAFHRWTQQQRRSALPGARISSVLMEMLRLCQRREAAQTLWPDIAHHVPVDCRYGSLWTEALTSRYRTQLTPRHFGTVCAHRSHRTNPAASSDAASITPNAVPILNR